MHSDAYCELLALINEAHVTTLNSMKLDYFFASYRNKLSPYEYISLENLRRNKFGSLH